jgi:hypothetical protein
MLKFSVQNFYQPLFSIFPSKILFLSAVFPFNSPKAQKPKVKPQKAKAKSPQPSFSGPFINSGKQSGAEALG